MERSHSCWENDFNPYAFSPGGGNLTAQEASFHKAETLELRVKSLSPFWCSPCRSSLLQMMRNSQGPIFQCSHGEPGPSGWVAEISSRVPVSLCCTELLRLLVALPRYRAPKLGPGTKNN